MPQRKGYKKRARHPRRYRKKAAGITAVVAKTSPVPDMFFCKLKYSHIFFLTTVAGVNSYLYKMNSLYDPDHSGAGHQPFGFDQLAALYANYRAYGVKYKITFQNTNATYVTDIAVVQKPNTTLTTDMQTAREKPYTQYRTLATSGNSHSASVIRGYHNCAKVFGVSKRRYADDDAYQASVGANPTSMSYLHIYQREGAGVTGIVTQVRVDLIYYCKFFSRKPLTGS